MFRKLLIKLTLLNASVIAILFFFLIAGVYLFAQYDINRHSKSFLSRVAADINAGRRPPMFPGPFNDPSTVAASDPRPASPSGPPPGLSFSRPVPPPDDEMPHPIIFYAKLDLAGAIVATSSTLPLPRAQLETLVQLVGKRSEPSSQIFFQDATYFYYSVERQDAPGRLLLFQNFERERGVFRTVMTALAVIGMFCFIASLFGSLFLARRAMKPIQQSWAQQRDFLADASHELRTPLAVMQASLDVIESNSDELVSEQTQWLNNIGESVKSMAALVESLLFLARIDTMQHPIDKKAFALDLAIANATTPYITLAATKKINLATELEPNLNLFGDEGRIKQVVGILLDNAIRHTPAGGEISVLLHRLNRSAQLTITDTGEGIPSAHLHKIFDRFYQVDPARNKGGAGLGLAIAKSIIEAHAGTIQAISKLGVGASFLIQLPLTTSHKESPAS
jgi:signal transduction histidine kinase